MKLLSLLVIMGVTSATQQLREFPKNFKFGTATAAYQIEGAWNVSDKAEQVWDHYTHYHSENVKDHNNGDVACDSYHLYKRDVQMLVELGVDYYRFSISWSRLLPEGYGTNVSQDGLRYYNNLIDELIKYNITPMVTLFHWDTPQKFTKIGGWTNPNIVDYFENYARLAFQHFGDRVKSWLTFNEPYNMCLPGYGTNLFLIRLAPNLNVHGIAEYQCTHNVLRAHANVYHLYNNTFKPTQQGVIGLATLVLWAEPETDSEEDKAIAEKALEFQTGWYLNAIHTPEGDYPKIMREEINKMSKQQGFKHSRLPYFTPEEVESLKNTADFIGVNYYTAVVYRNDGKRADRQVPSFENDIGHVVYQPEEWDKGFSRWLKIRPHGLRDTLNWVKKKYGDQEIYITEIGYSTNGGLLDEDRVDFFNKHLEATLDAIDDGVNVTHFTTWSLMDNFEWMSGYSERFGLYQVDFASPQKTRKPRMSAVVLQELFRTRKFDPDYRPEFELPVEAIEEFPVPILQISIILSTFVLLTAICLILAFKLVSYKKKTMQSTLKETKIRSCLLND